MSTIESYLKSCRELTCFCSGNGWIDNDSLHFRIVMETENEIFVDVEFEEMLMEGSGCRGGKVSCHGQMHLFLDPFGRVIRAEVL